MKEETAKQAAELLHELDALQDIKNATIKEESHWWGFVAPDCKTWNDGGLTMPAMDVEMMLLGIDFDNEVLKLAPIDIGYYEDNAIGVSREFCDKPRAIRMKVIKGKKG